MNSPTTPASPALRELHRFLERYPDLAYVDGIFVDLCGIVRGKRYPRDELDKLFTAGFPIPYSIYLLDATGACTDACGRGFSDGDPDGIALPVPGTLVPVPWAEQSAGQVLMSMHTDDGKPAMVEPRNLARAVVERFDTLGLRPRVAFELEFYLLDPQLDECGRPRPPVSPRTGRRERSTQVYGIEELEGFTGYFRDLERASQSQSVPVSVATSEYAAGQYEVNLRHVDDPVQAADHCALLRHLVKRVARSHDLAATFMSKPFPDQTGNGMHLHLSLADAHGRNVFDDGTEAGSDSLRHAVGGLLETMYDAMAVLAPNVNAYRRYGPNLYVPVNRSWAYNNRSAAVRIPAGEPANRRFEHRVGGADANPYLVLAVVLAGVHHGLVGQRVRDGRPGDAARVGRGNRSIGQLAGAARVPERGVLGALLRDEASGAARLSRPHFQARVRLVPVTRPRPGRRQLVNDSGSLSTLGLEFPRRPPAGPRDRPPAGRAVAVRATAPSGHPHRAGVAAAQLGARR